MTATIHVGDCSEVMRGMDPESVQCVVTSPPYFGLRDYGVEGQLGLEETPDEYVAKMVEVFQAVRRVLKPTGTLWLNLGDSYNGQGARGPNIKPNGDLSYRAGLPHLAVVALASDLRQGSCL